MSRCNQMFLWCVMAGAVMLAAVPVSAQENADAGYSGPSAAAPQPTTADSQWQCMSQCMERYQACVDRTSIYVCLLTIPACRGFEETTIVTRMCDLCAVRGSPANSCPGTDPSAAAAEALAQQNAPYSSPASTAPVTAASAAPQRARRRPQGRPRPEDVCRARNLPLQSSQCLCLRENGVWTRNYPYRGRDGQMHQADFCLTSPFAALEGRVDDLDRRVGQTDNPRPLTDRVQALENRIEGTGSGSPNPSTMTESRVNEIVDHAVGDESQRRLREREELLTNMSSYQRQMDAQNRQQARSSLTGFRVNAFAGLDFIQIPSENGMVTPFYIGLELSWLPRFARGWYGDAGVGLGYAGPMTFGAHHIESMVHLGFLTKVHPNIGLSFGMLFMERMTLQFQGSNALLGPYGEILFTSSGSGPAFFAGLRLSAGARFQSIQDMSRVDFGAMGALTAGFILL